MPEHTVDDIDRLIAELTGTIATDERTVQDISNENEEWNRFKLLMRAWSWTHHPSFFLSSHSPKLWCSAPL